MPRVCGATKLKVIKNGGGWIFHTHMRPALKAGYAKFAGIVRLVS